MKEPLLCHEVPSHPWAKVGADLCEVNGKAYLLFVDYWIHRRYTIPELQK